MAARATRSASRKARLTEAVATGPLGALSHDELGVIFDGLADPLQPVVAVALSSTCLGLRTPLWAALEVLKERHARAVALIRKALVHDVHDVDGPVPPLTHPNYMPPMSCLEARRAPLMVWATNGGWAAADDVWVSRPLTEHAEMATLGMLLHKYLPNVTRLALPGNPAVDDAGMQALCEGLGRGDAPSLRALDLSDTSFGPAGAEALAAALSRGAMLNLETVYWPSVKNLGDQGVAALAAPLRKLPALKELYLFDCEIGDEGMASLFSNLGKDDFKMLKTFNLGDNNITDIGCATLVKVIDGGRLASLKHVPLYDNAATDAALQAVDAALDRLERAR